MFLIFTLFWITLREVKHISRIQTQLTILIFAWQYPALPLYVRATLLGFCLFPFFTLCEMWIRKISFLQNSFILAFATFYLLERKTGKFNLAWTRFQFKIVSLTQVYPASLFTFEAKDVDAFSIHLLFSLKDFFFPTFSPLQFSYPAKRKWSIYFEAKVVEKHGWMIFR